VGVYAILLFMLFIYFWFQMTSDAFEVAEGSSLGLIKKKLFRHLHEEIEEN
jgi:hypothetical protein